ncbi:MAG: hypothetical protein HKN57_14390 [Xanthomonadales bacterium]|jgi:uncharacterized membrane protein YgaE (UPF0421/DUF939 family)|nr:hypothetical protein [Xanthomonadales bacterium]
MEASVIGFLASIGIAIFLAFKHYKVLDSVVAIQVTISLVIVLAVLSFFLLFAGSRFLSEILMFIGIGVSVFTIVSIKLLEHEPEPEEEDVADNLQDRIDQMVNESKNK